MTGATEAETVRQLVLISAVGYWTFPDQETWVKEGALCWLSRPCYCCSWQQLATLLAVATKVACRICSPRAVVGKGAARHLTNEVPVIQTLLGQAEVKVGIKNQELLARRNVTYTFRIRAS